MADTSFYVYVHRRATDGSIFYVGKGKGQRGATTVGRNKHWNNIVAKNGYEIEYVCTDLTSACACSIEKILIAAIGRKNLANMTGGGEGMLDPSPETRKKMSENRLGKPQSLDHAEKSRKAKLGKKQPQSAIDGLRKRKSKPIIASDGRIFPSASEAARVLSKELGKYVSQGNISISANMKRSNAYELSWSYDLSKVPVFQETNQNSKKIRAVEIDKLFKSAQAAKLWVQEWRGSANNQCITQAARTGGRAYGYHWEYMEQDV